MSYYLGVDIGGTKLRAAVGTDDGTVVGTSKIPTPTASSPTSVPDAIVRVIELACAEADVDPRSITAVGVGSAGPFDMDAGAIINSPNIAGEDGRVPVVQPLRERLDTDSITLRNDATCGVIAERHFSDQSTENMIYLTISTGIGAGVVVDDNVLYGNGGNAAEVGHMTIDPTGRMTCGCGLEGHWEAYCSGANIPDYAAGLSRDTAIETGLPIDDPDFTAKDVFDAACDDGLADLVLDRVGRWNVIGFANLIQTFAPSHISVGGAVAINNPNAVLDPVREGVSTRAIADIPSIELSELGEDVVLRGALLSAQR